MNDLLTQLDRYLPEDAEREAKLPRWAVEQLQAARRITREAIARAEQARLATHPAESSAVLEGRAINDTEIGLGDDPKVRFKLGRASVTGRVKYLPREGAFLELYTDGGPLMLLPQITNVVRVVVRPR